MKSLICKWLLSVLNSRWLNGSPADYGFVNNIDAFSRHYLEEHGPDTPVHEILNPEMRDATLWDIHSLRQQLRDDR